MEKEKCECKNGCDCEVDYYECDCNCSIKNKLIKVGACVGVIAILGGVIASLVIKNKKN